LLDNFVRHLTSPTVIWIKCAPFQGQNLLTQLCPIPRVELSQLFGSMLMSGRNPKDRPSGRHSFDSLARTPVSNLRKKCVWKKLLRVFSEGLGNGTKVGATITLIYDDEWKEHGI